MVWIALLLVVFLTIFANIYIKSNVIANDLRKKGLKFVKPIPGFGNLLKFLLGRQHISEVLRDAYKSSPNERYTVLFEFTTPIIVARDVELLKKINVKDFDYFHNSPFMIDENIDPVFGRILLCLRDSKWYQMRTSLSPLYTSAKMKNMFNFMTAVSKTLVKHCEEEMIKNNPENPNKDFEFKDLSSRYTNDVMASSAFNFKINSFEDRDNEFVLNAQEISVHSLWVVVKFGLFKVFPTLMKMLRLRVMKQNTVYYITELLRQALNERRKSGEYRPDMIHMLLEAQKGTLKREKSEKLEHFSVNEETLHRKNNSIETFDDDDLIAQAVIFILAGWGGSSHGISYTAYALALYPEIQQRLQDEIDGVLLKNEGVVTYNDIIEMKYLDMVVSETLRRYTPFTFGSRQCAKDYDLGPVSDQNPYRYILKKDESVWLPLHMVHMDPKNWPDPEKFDPERFSEENRKFIKPFSYMPFGVGPRGCIGARFAVIQLKVALFYILAKFNLKTCSRTVYEPFDLKMETFFTEPVQGYWLNVQRRRSYLKL